MKDAEYHHESAADVELMHDWAFWIDKNVKKVWQIYTYSKRCGNKANKEAVGEFSVKESCTYETIYSI